MVRILHIFVLWGRQYIYISIPTGCEWPFKYLWRAPIDIFSYDHQYVGTFADFVMALTDIFFLWLKVGEDQQNVSGIHLFERQFYDAFQVSWLIGSEWHCIFTSLVTYSSMTNRMWVTLHIFQKAVSWYLFLLPPASDITHILNSVIMTIMTMTNAGWVTLHILVKSSLMMFFPIINRKWAMFVHLMKGSYMIYSPVENRMWVTSYAVHLHFFLLHFDMSW